MATADTTSIPPSLTRPRSWRSSKTGPPSHWDHPDGYFDWAGDARRVTESYVSDNSVFILVDSDGRKLGFNGFTEDDDGLLPDRMFLDETTSGRSHPC